MSDDLADSTARLAQLVAQIMKETDPVKYDELGTEIWRVLSERERFIKQMSSLISRVMTPTCQAVPYRSFPAIQISSKKALPPWPYENCLHREESAVA
jgi:hypothetical protein